MDELFGHSSGDPGHADVPPFWQPRQLTLEHRQLGLTPNTEEGALLEFAANLDSSKLSHIVIAWVLLLAFALPPLLLVVNLLFRASFE
jgi:hypothetical protein